MSIVTYTNQSITRTIRSNNNTANGMNEFEMIEYSEESFVVGDEDLSHTAFQMGGKNGFEEAT